MERLSGLRALNKRLRLALKGKLTLGKTTSDATGVTEFNDKWYVVKER